MKLMQAAVSFTPNGREPIDAGQVVEVEVDEWHAEIEAGFLVPIVKVAGRDWQSHGSDDSITPPLTEAETVAKWPDLADPDRPGKVRDWSTDPPGEADVETE